MLREVIFDNPYLWQWMGAGTPREASSGLHSYLGTGHDGWGRILAGVSPDFLASFPQPSRGEGRRKLHQMCKYVPAQLWQEMLCCAKQYHEFFARFWPDLSRVADDLVYLEWLLYVEPGYMEYREHLVHMFKVACVGTWFLRNDSFANEVARRQWGRNGHFAHWMKKQFPGLDVNNDEKRLIIRWAFLLGAMMHDFGYAYSLRSTLDARLSPLFEWTTSLCGNSEPCNEMQKSLENSLCMEFIRRNLACRNSQPRPDTRAARRRATGFVRDVLMLNHSMASCLFVLGMRNKLQHARALNDMLRVAFEIAAEAVMIHDMGSVDNWCGLRDSGLPVIDDNRRHFLDENSYSAMPVGVLLMLCDELAVWSRPEIAEPSRNEPADRVTYRLTFEEAARSMGVEFTDTTLNVSLGFYPLTTSCARNMAEKLRRDVEKNLHRKCPVLRGRFFGRTIGPVTTF